MFFQKMAILYFIIFCVFNTAARKQIKILLMTGFEPRTSGLPVAQIHI